MSDGIGCLGLAAAVIGFIVLTPLAFSGRLPWWLGIAGGVGGLAGFCVWWAWGESNNV